MECSETQEYVMILLYCYFNFCIGRGAEGGELREVRVRKGVFLPCPSCQVDELCFLLRYRPSPEKRSHQLIVTLYTESIYPSVHNHLMRTIFEGRPVAY